MENAPYSFEEVEAEFRGAITRLSMSPAKLGALPKDCTFTVSIDLKAGADIPLGNPPEWVLEQQSARDSKESRESKESQEESQESVLMADTAPKGPGIGVVTSVPIRSVNTGPMRMDFYIEESKSKQKLPAGADTV